MLSKKKKREFLKWISRLAGKEINTKTVDIAKFDTLYDKDEFVKANPGVLIRFNPLPNPKPGCKKCYGRGYTSIMVSDGTPVVCTKCVFKDIKPIGS